MPKAIEEMLRFRSPTQALGRRPLEDVELHGVAIPAQSWVTVVYGSANRDERVFPDPDTFDLDRDLRRHVAFSAGIHYCPGAPVTRAETHLLLEELLDRYTSVERAGPSRPNPNPMPGMVGKILGWSQVPVRFVGDPGPGRPMTRAAPQPRLRGSKLPYRVASAIVEEVVDRDLAVGDALPSEPELAEQFGISRASIREALRVLETFGVVRIKPGKNGGNAVGALDADALARSLALFFRMARVTYRDLMDARLVIEPYMARRAAERDDEQLLAELRATLEREAASTAGTRDGDEAALAFHRLLCGASGNPAMDSLGRAIHALYGDRLAADLLYEPGVWATVRQVHQEIGQAILAGNGGRAQELTAAHMQDFHALQQQRTPLLLDDRVVWTP